MNIETKHSEVKSEAQKLSIKGAEFELGAEEILIQIEDDIDSLHKTLDRALDRLRSGKVMG